MEENKQLSTEVNEAPEFGDGPTGIESIDSASKKIPFLKLAKDGTDEAKRASASYIPGLLTGQFFCGTLKKVYGDKMRMVVLKYYHQYTVFDGEDINAKFLGSISTRQFEQDVLPHATRKKSFHLDQNGHRYVDTRNFIVVPYDNPEDGPMIFSLSSTGIGPSREWCSLIDAVRVNKNGSIEQAPIWTSVWEIRSGTIQDPTWGAYFQMTGVSRLGWTPKGKAAEYYRGLFLQAQDFDPSKLMEPEATVEESLTQAPQAMGEKTSKVLKKTGLVDDEPLPF